MDQFSIDFEGLLMYPGSVKVVSVETTLTCLNSLLGNIILRFVLIKLIGISHGIKNKGTVERCYWSFCRQGGKQSCLYGNCFRHNTSYQACAGALVMQHTDP